MQISLSDYNILRHVNFLNKDVAWRQQLCLKVIKGLGTLDRKSQFTIKKIPGNETEWASF